MYGNVESTQGQGQMWVLRPGEEALCSTEENTYEPLDPITTSKPAAEAPAGPWARAASVGLDHAPVKAGSTRFYPNRGLGVAHPSSGCRSKEKLVLVGTVALGVSVLLNVIFLAVGLRHITALTEELAVAKVKELPSMATTLTKDPDAEKANEPPNLASSSFLLYNQHQNKCIVARGHQLTATGCQPAAPAQRFQWLSSGRLWHVGSQRCITASSELSLAEVTLEPCGDGGRRQRWECGDGGLLALAGHRLYFNYGNNAKHTVMLYSGDREWSRWVVYGTAAAICSRSCCPPCSKGWIYFRNSCYFYSKTKTSWENAQRFCSVLGTQLLEVDGPEEKNHIQKMLESSSWLGIRDEEAEGTWKRANGTVVKRENSSWHRNEPNGGSQENCAAVREDGEWYDYPCSSELPWVCEGHP